MGLCSCSFLGPFSFWLFCLFIYYYYYLEKPVCFLIRGRKVGGSGSERMWGRTGRSGWREKYTQDILWEKKSIFHKRNQRYIWPNAAGFSFEKRCPSPQNMAYLPILALPRKAPNNECISQMRLWKKSAYVSGLLKREVLFLDKFGYKGGWMLPGEFWKANSW